MNQALNEIVKDPLTGEAQLAQAQRMLLIMDQAAAGTAVVTQLVKESNVAKAAMPAINAISASLEVMLTKENVTHQDKVAWSMATLLAAYELGKLTKLDPPNPHIRPS